MPHQPIPRRFTAELEAGWSVGAVLVDGEGRAVEGVKIRPSIQFKKRAGDLQELQVGTNLTTDDAGKWRRGDAEQVQTTGDTDNLNDPSHPTAHL